jgi:iron-sulfur cluster assembly accessory protein
MINFTLSDTALARVSHLLSQKKTLQNDTEWHLRVAVDGGGCSGFMYRYEITNNQVDGDLIMHFSGVSILIDDVSSEFLDGCKLNFVEELGNEYFEIINPKAAAKCGCGNSFAL